MFDAAAETMPRGALASLQTERLRGVLHQAYA
jgi:phenylacetate-coenzyme A ligase PaaK-like adenylate-forming protein